MADPNEEKSSGEERVDSSVADAKEFRDETKELEEDSSQKVWFSLIWEQQNVGEVDI